MCALRCTLSGACSRVALRASRSRHVLLRCLLSARLALQPQETQVEKLQPGGARSKYGAESTTADDDDLPGDELAASRDKKAGGGAAAKKKKKRRDDDDDDEDEEEAAPTKDQDIERLRAQYKDKPATKGTLVASAKFSKQSPAPKPAAAAAAVEDDEPAFVMRPAAQGKRINMKVLSANNSDDDNEPTPELDADRAGDEEARRIQSEMDAQTSAMPRRWSNNEEPDYESAMPGASDDESRFQMNIQSSAGGLGYADALEPTGFHLHHPGSYGGSNLQSAAASKQHSRRTSHTDDERAMQARRDRRSTGTGTHTLQPPAMSDTIHPSDRPSFSPTNAASSSSSRSGRDDGLGHGHKQQDSMVMPGQIDDGTGEQWGVSSGVDSDAGGGEGGGRRQRHARKQTRDRRELHPTHPSSSHSPTHDADASADAVDGGAEDTTQPQTQQHSPQQTAISNGGAFGNTANSSPQQRQRNVRAMALSQSRVDGDDAFDF